MNVYICEIFLKIASLSFSSSVLWIVTVCNIGHETLGLQHLKCFAQGALVSFGNNRGNLHLRSEPWDRQLEASYIFCRSSVWNTFVAGVLQEVQPLQCLLQQLHLHKWQGKGPFQMIQSASDLYKDEVYQSLLAQQTLGASLKASSSQRASNGLFKGWNVESSEWSCLCTQVVTASSCNLQISLQLRPTIAGKRCFDLPSSFESWISSVLGKDGSYARQLGQTSKCWLEVQGASGFRFGRQWNSHVMTCTYIYIYIYTDIQNK